MNDFEFSKFIESHLARYTQLTGSVVSILEKVLNQSDVEFLNVSGRTKTQNSIMEKFSRKNYLNIENQMTDISGIRIITFLNSQVNQISDIVKRAFFVDNKNSLDRGSILGDDKIGYRSVHFVCTLGAERKGVIEYNDLCDLKFEIQIRTVLQHAWAELAHDRSYKFNKSLPTNLQREMNLYSGMLEVVDSAFDRLANSIEKYQIDIQKDSDASLSNEAINSISLTEFARRLQQKYKIADTGGHIQDENAIRELGEFGIKTIGQLNAISSDEVLQKIVKFEKTSSAAGLVRSIMMLDNLDKYFKNTSHLWGRLWNQTYRMLISEYGKERIDNLMKKYSIVLTDEVPFAAELR